MTILNDVAADQEMTINAYHSFDLTEDGILNFFDISQLIQLYVSGDPQADINDDSMVNVLDIMAFITGYQNPCQ